jgi:hypothetical protein
VKQGTAASFHWLSSIQNFRLNLPNRRRKAAARLRLAPLSPARGEIQKGDTHPIILAYNRKNIHLLQF